MLIITQRMSEPIVEWAGSSCGKHGAYTFYKGFKLTANGETRKYLLGEFYFIRNSKDRPICIAEFQLLWHDANTDNKLASARLYFRPESIPGGRQSCHGRDELLYTDEKVVINCKDMMNLEYDGAGWSYGIKAISELNLQEVPTAGNNDSEDTKKFRLLKRKSKSKKMMPKERVKMVILSFPAYCRFKSLMKKLSNGLVLTKIAIEAFGGIIQCTDGTWVSFSRESFHHPGLAKYDMFMHNKAPVLKGRPRKKKVSSKTTASKEEIKVKRNNATVDQQPSNEAESSDDNHTDSSETSSIQELPCPPKLVSSIKEEKRMGVIQCVKQDATPVAIPPVPKLVKIEPEKPIPYGRYNESGLMYTNQISGHQIEKNIPLKVSYSNSVITNSPYRDDGQTNRVSSTTQTREKCIRVGNICPASLPANVHASFVSHAATITTNHNIQPRMSTIMPTAIATQGEVTQNLGTSDGDKTRAEQPLKRKRGRPPGKSNKCLKSSEVKIAPKTAVEDDQVQIKDEDEYMYTETLMECEEYSPEPQTAEERDFMKNLKIFMRKRGSPIEKIPALGFRKINLFKMYEVTQALGGYDQVTNKKLWRRVYSEVGGAPRITSAATNSRKHYEKLLLPFEKCSRGEEYLLDDKGSESPSPTPDDLPRKDQNGNVVSQNEATFLSTSQQEKLSQPLITIQKQQNERSIPVLSNAIQPCKQDTRIKAAVTGVISQQDTLVKAAVTGALNKQDTRLKTAVTDVVSYQDTRLKAAVTGVISHHNTRLKAAVTGVMSQQDTRLKSAVTGVISQQDNHLKIAVTGVTSRPNELFKSAVSRGTSLLQQDMPNPMRSQEDRHVSFVTSMKTQNKETITSHQDRISRPLTVHNTERTHHTQPKSLSYQDQQDRRLVVHSKAQHQYNKAADHDSPVEFITTGSRSSPIMLSNAKKLSARYQTFDPQGVRHSARGFTGTDHMSSPDSLRSNRKEDCQVIRTEDYSAIYARQHKTESRMSEFESKPKYLSRFDHVNDFGMPRDHHAEESHDMIKHAQGTGDEILLTNVIPGKRAHSPHDVIYSYPVIQPSHYPHGSYELCDLPSTTFPVRASSRIFMPPHQVFPGPGHLAFSPYTPHIIATIGTDPSALYQLPMPGYYPHELAYPLDTGVQILHS